MVHEPMMLNSFSSMPLLIQLMATALMALLFVYLFGLGFPWNAANASHSQDGTLALYWMHRTHTTPYRNWFYEPTDGDEAVRQVFEEITKEGNVVLPLHAVYLWVLGHVVHLYTWAVTSGVTSRRLASFWEKDFFSYIGTDEAPPSRVGETLFAVRWISCLLLLPVLFQLSVEVLWPLMVSVAAYLVRATEQRRQAARVRAPSPNHRDSAADTASADPAAVEARTQTLTRKMASIGFLASFVFVVLPTMALEATTLHPVCLCTCAVLQCVRLYFLDEAMLSSAKTYARECFSNQEADMLFQQGSVFAFPLKRPLTLRYVCQAAALQAAVGLSLRPCLCLAVGLAGWGLTLCYLRVHRRVFVRVKAPDGGADAPEAASDGFVDIGYSSYQDKLYAQLCLCYVMSCALAVVVVVCVPFWYGKQTLFEFMDLFAPGYHPEPGFYHPRPSALAAKAPTGEAGFLSVTGAGEMVEECVLNPLLPPRHFSCLRPVVSVYSLSEYFGFPWTHMTVWFASLIAPNALASRADASMWMQYVSVLSLVVSNAVCALLVVAYRIRRPLTSFDAPKEFLLTYDAQRERFFNYWAAKADELRTRKKYPPPATPFVRPTAAGAGPAPDDVVKTCVSQEEYVLKQITALLWVLLMLAVTSNLLLVRGGLALGLGGAVLLPAGVLYALQAMVGASIILAPEAFDPARNRRQFDHIAFQREEEEVRLRSEKQEREAKGAAENTTEGVAQPPAGAAGDDVPPPVPEEHACTRTFLSGGFSYTSPVFAPDGTGWSLSSRWCSPASLGEHTDAAWCLLAITAVAGVCFQTYPLAPLATLCSGSVDVEGEAPFGFSFSPAFPLSRFNGSTCTFAGLLILLFAELVACRFWRRFDLLTLTVILFCQAAGGYAGLKGMFFNASQASGSFGGGVAAVGVWAGGVMEVVTGPSLLFDAMSQHASAPLSRYMWTCVYRCTVAAGCLALAGVHASMRMVRLMLESEEVRFVDPAKEMERIYHAAKNPSSEKGGGHPALQKATASTHKKKRN